MPLPMSSPLSLPNRLQIEHRPELGRFEALVKGHLNVAEYRLEHAVMQMTHTEVHPSLARRGIAAALVQAALDHARAHDLRVAPRCSYVRHYFERHPESRDLLA